MHGRPARARRATPASPRAHTPSRFAHLTQRRTPIPPRPSSRGRWTRPTRRAAISFPAASGIYRNAGWNDFSGSASDTGGAAVANVQVSISRVSSGLYWDGSAFADGSENWRAATGTTSWSLAFASSNFPSDGDYTVSVRATDTATNVQTTPVSRTFTIDNAAPATTITTQPNDPTNSTAPGFSFSSDEPGSTFECQLDTGGWSSCTSPKSFTGLTQASHTFEVRATDTAGNVDASPASFTWTIDTTEPVSTVNFPTAGSFYNTAGWADVDGTASDTGGSALADVQVAIQRVSTSLYWNGAAFADGSVNWHAATGTATWSLAFAAANFPDGDDYVVRVRAHDTAGNFEAAGAYSVTYDTTAPATTIDSQPNALDNSADAAFSFSSNDPGATFECKLDAAPFASCSSPKSYSALTDGAHSFQVRATDAAGNSDATPANFDWTIDTTAPTTTIDSQPNALDNSADAAFSFSSNDPGATFECKLDAAPFASCSSPKSYSALTDGAHSFQVRATDAAGNSDATPANFDWTIDTTAPTTTIDSQPNALDNSADAAFSFSSNDPGATFECKLDAAPFASCSSPKSYSALTDGAHSFQVRATDAAGNSDATPANFDWTIDTTAPTTTIDSQPNALDNSADAAFSFSSNDPGATFECKLDAAPFASCSSPKSYSALTDGAHSFQVRATDAAGNSDATPANFDWTIDTTAPTTTIDSQPNALDNSADAAFSFSSNDPGATFECKLDAAPFASCSSPKSYSALTDGAHSFQVRATDAAGNSDATPANFDWTIDTTAPTTTIDSQPNALDNSADAAFSFSSNDPGATFECKLDAAPFASCSSPKSYSALTDGAHSFQVRATDAAGNSDATPANFDWTIDTTAPTTTIDSQPNALDNSADAAFSFSSNDPGATFECKLDAAPFASCSSPKSYSALTDGAHSFQVRATDAAGNSDATPANFDWTIDTTAPTTTIDSQPNALDNSADAAFSFSSNDPGATFECKLDAAPLASCSSPKSYSALTDGAHSFQVRATDAAGNSDATPANFDWTIDTTAPTTTIDSQPNALDNSADAAFSFSSNDPGATFECKLDAAPFASCSSPKSYSALTDGAHSFQVRATDAAGNSDATPANFDWTIDTTAPSSATSFPANIGSYNILGWNAGCFPSGICGTASDSGTGLDRVEVSIQRAADNQYWNGSAFASATEVWNSASGTATWTLGFPAATFPGDGSYTIQVRARDNAGNVEAPAGRTFTIDTTAPQTQITAQPNDPTNSTDASFSFSSAEPGATFECKLDGGSFAACTSPAAHTGLPAGPHSFEVRATDDAGNTDATPGENWTIDLTAPNSTVSFPTDSGSYNAVGWTNPSGTATDAVALDQVEVSLRIAGGNWWNGTDFSATSETWHTATGAAAWSLAFPENNFTTDGDYVIRVRATDAAGNTETPSSRAFTVDTVAPETTIDSAPANPLADADADFTFSADQSGSTFECRIDGGTWAACTSPKSYTSLSEGSHTVEVRATDLGGNTDLSPGSRTWVIDTVPPVATMDDPGQYLKGTVALSSNVTDTGGTGVDTVGFERSPAGAGTWTPVPASWNTTGTANGLYDLRVVATDQAGNSSSLPHHLFMSLPPHSNGCCI